MPVWLLVTTRLLSVTFPALLTLPLKVSRAPGLTGMMGQIWVITSRAVLATGQPVVFVAIAWPVQVVWPWAVTTPAFVQESKGTV